MTVAPAMTLLAVSLVVPDKLLTHDDGVVASILTVAEAWLSGVTVVPAVAFPSAVTVVVVAAS